MPIPPDLPLWLSLILAALLLGGSLCAFIGALGLACFRNFYDRLHFPGLSSTLGAAAILAACALYSSYLAGALILGDALILFFISVAAPISLMILTRAAAMRDFTKSWRDHSPNMFWQLAHDPITDETDAEADKQLKREDARLERKDEREETHAAQAAAAQAKAEAAINAAAAGPEEAEDMARTAAAQSGESEAGSDNAAAPAATAKAASAAK